MLIPLKQKTWDLQKYQDDGFHDLQKKMGLLCQQKNRGSIPQQQMDKNPKAGWIIHQVWLKTNDSPINIFKNQRIKLL